MAFYTMIGLIVVASLFGVGVYWSLTNITFKRQPKRYTYSKDSEGNEIVKVYTDEEA